MSSFESTSASASKPDTVNFLYPGSFSPVTESHTEAIRQLIKFGKEDGYKNVNVYVIPATDQYQKASIYKPPGATPPDADYLSENSRKLFLEQAKLKIEIPEGCDVIISESDFKYGKGYYTVNGSASKGLMPTAFIALNYNKDVTVASTNGTEKLLEKPENFENSDTFLILGGDNAYTDVVGWSDPKTILDNIGIFVISRGEPPTVRTRSVKKTYYKQLDGSPAAFPQPFEAVVAERNAIYGDGYDIEKHMAEKYKKLDFSVPEMSSSLLRKIVKGVPIDESDGFENVLTQLKSNNTSFNSNVNEYLREEDKIVKPAKKNEVIEFLTPANPEMLISAYDNGGEIPQGSKGGSCRTRRRQNKKRKSRKNKKRSYKK